MLIKFPNKNRIRNHPTVFACNFNEIKAKILNKMQQPNNPQRHIEIPQSKPYTSLTGLGIGRFSNSLVNIPSKAYLIGETY